ncbi:hypothetical protein [Paraburkholderia polaris]|uniref:hypothetical protein n=1 Tax=Paraburkholderia polaris TaxID=2728848 RepID=UPI00197D3C01|nr:hypothetical protein [Paraburkholderia polaris]
MISQNDNGEQSATTRSAVSAGTINITDGAHQTQDVASLSRDTTNANGTVTKTPDVNDILNRQADTMQAAQAAGQTVSQGIGAYADRKRDDAVTALQAAKDRGDTEGMAAALVDYNNWREGGTYRIGMHIAGGALTAGLGGGGIGSAAQGAAGAGIAAWAAGDLNRLANGTRDALGGGDAAQMAGNVLSNVVAGAGGFLIGGTTGAFTASNADLYNRSTGNGDGQGSTAKFGCGYCQQFRCRGLERSRFDRRDDRKCAERRPVCFARRSGVYLGGWVASALYGGRSGWAGRGVPCCGAGYQGCRKGSGC